MTSVVDPAFREETAKHAPYAQWGWRVPFVFGAAISAALFFYYRWKLVGAAIEWGDQRAAARAMRNHLGHVADVALLRGN